MRVEHIITLVHEAFPAGSNVLSAIIPLTQMAGRLEVFDSWLSESANLPINIVIVHDIQDALTSSELLSVVNRHKQLEIKIIEGAFGSPGIARNAGLVGVLARWVAFWDADDLPNPQEVIAAILEANSDTEVIIGDFTINSDKGIKHFKHCGRLDTVAMNPGLWRMVVRSTILSGTRFSSVRMGEDQLFLVELNLGLRKIYFCERIFYQYFQGNSMQLTLNQDAINEVEKTYSLAKQRINSNPHLRNEFSEMIILRLAITSILRTNRRNGLHLLIKSLSMFLKIHPKTLLHFIFMLSKRQGANDEQ